jgi:CDP-glucose 4,6-dehydratase
MGTVHLLEAVRHTPSVRAVVNVTSDKCYKNREWVWGYREHEPMGGYDPYSNSKGCAELVTAAYRNSFFNSQLSTLNPQPSPLNPQPSTLNPQPSTAIATARAGNVIGGGDWAADRLIPDLLRAFDAGQPAVIRSPHAIRPWQHVLEPLSGYLLLAERLYNEGAAFAEGWNFGPNEADVQPVQWIVERLTAAWGAGASWRLDADPQPHEAHYLKLDCAKAKARLGWTPRWPLAEALRRIVAWQLALRAGAEMRAWSLAELADYPVDYSGG